MTFSASDQHPYASPPFHSPKKVWFYTSTHLVLKHLFQPKGAGTNQVSYTMTLTSIDIIHHIDTPIYTHPLNLPIR